MAVLKGTPTTYNKDFQECWELMFDSVDALHDCIRIATGVLSTIKINEDRMLKVCQNSFICFICTTWLDAADFIVRWHSMAGYLQVAQTATVREQQTQIEQRSHHLIPEAATSRASCLLPFSITCFWSGQTFT